MALECGGHISLGEYDCYDVFAMATPFQAYKTECRTLADSVQLVVFLPLPVIYSLHGSHSVHVAFGEDQGEFIQLMRGSELAS